MYAYVKRSFELSGYPEFSQLLLRPLNSSDFARRKRLYHTPGVPGLRPRRLREDMNQEEYVAAFSFGGTRAKNPAPVSWSHRSRKRRKFPSPPPLGLPRRNRGVYFLHMYPARNATHSVAGGSCGKINATFVFLALRSFSEGGSSRCLRVSSRTRRVVNLDFCYCLVAELLNSSDSLAHETLCTTIYCGLVLFNY